MIKTENYKVREDGVQLVRTYSTENKYIKKVNTDEKYEEAIDITGHQFKYVETDEDIPVLKEEDNSEFAAGGSWNYVHPFLHIYKANGR
jgi:hypothetical protein